MKRIRNLTILLSFMSFFYLIINEATDDGTQIEGTSVQIFRGYYKREHSLIKPYQGSGMDIPFWDIFGNLIISPSQIRLTADIRSQNGAIWNKVPCTSKDWELIVNFRVHGSTGHLFGDGMAIWYVQDPNIIGDVFGSKDYFRGLGIFLDTYSNHNGPHTHSHPYISAMVSNGSQHYDHDRDGTHTQLGGEHTGCECKFRNKDHDTQILVRYVGDTLSIFTDTNGEGLWKECFKADGVFLPTHYYFGISAATGDLSDNHDVVGIRMFEQEFHRAEKPFEVDRKLLEPRAEHYAAPRDHVTDKRPSNLGWFGTIMLIIVGLAIIGGVVFTGGYFLQQRHDRARKRFY